MHGEIGEMHLSLGYTWPLSRSGRTQETQMGRALLVQDLSPDSSDGGRAETVSPVKGLPPPLHALHATTLSTEALTLNL